MARNMVALFMVGLVVTGGLKGGHSSHKKSYKIDSDLHVQLPAHASVVVAWDIDDVLLHDGRPCLSAFNLVRELNKKGVRQVLFTNKPVDGFKKLQSNHPAFFNNKYFDMSRSVIGGRIFEKKPYAPNYQKILNYNAGDCMIFFDDKKENIIAAKSHGIDAHVWTYNCRSSVSNARLVLRNYKLI